MNNHNLELGNVQSLLKRIQNEDERRERPRIFMVPKRQRDHNPWCFTPRVVSIGPLHKGYENLQAFERQKATYVNLILRISSTDTKETLKLCMEMAYASMDAIKACYDQTIPYEDTEFVEMMVMDACFILGFVFHMSDEYHDRQSYLGNMLLDQTVLYDLVLLENQIPFFFLNEIYRCTISELRPNTSLVEYLIPLLLFLNLFEQDIDIKNVSVSTVDHILSLFYECYKPHPDLGITSGLLTSRVHSAIDLDRAGVNFKPAKNSKWVMGMDVKLPSFPCFSWCWGKPTFRMPVLYVDDFTELLLRNLITYEQQSMQARKYITSYAYAMDILVNSKKDVAKLVESRVLINDMGTNGDAANVINNICREVSKGHFFYAEEWKKLDEYCNGYWPQNIAWLRSTYFNSPWNMIALFGGIILFILTVVQTIFTIKSA